MRNAIPWMLAVLGVGYATWAVATDGGLTPWSGGRAPVFLGGMGWTNGCANINAAKT